MNRPFRPHEADFRNGTAHRSPFRTLPLCGRNAQLSDNQPFGNYRRTGIFQCTPTAPPGVPTTNHQLHPKPGNSSTAVFPTSATPPYRTHDTATSPLLDLQPGSDAGTAAGIYDLRRLKIFSSYKLSRCPGFAIHLPSPYLSRCCQHHPSLDGGTDSVRPSMSLLSPYPSEASGLGRCFPFVRICRSDGTDFSFQAES